MNDTLDSCVKLAQSLAIATNRVEDGMGVMVDVEEGFCLLKLHQYYLKLEEARKQLEGSKDSLSKKFNDEISQGVFEHKTTVNNELEDINKKKAKLETKLKDTEENLKKTRRMNSELQSSLHRDEKVVKQIGRVKSRLDTLTDEHEGLRSIYESNILKYKKKQEQETRVEPAEEGVHKDNLFFQQHERLRREILLLSRENQTGLGKEKLLLKKGTELEELKLEHDHLTEEIDGLQKDLEFLSRSLPIILRNYWRSSPHSAEYNSIFHELVEKKIPIEVLKKESVFDEFDVEEVKDILTNLGMPIEKL